MSDLNALVVSCAGQHAVTRAVNRIKESLPIEIRKRLARIFSDYLVHYGLDGIYERMNNRSVAEILTEYLPGNDVTVLATGEVDGVRYGLVQTEVARRRLGCLPRDLPPLRVPCQGVGKELLGRNPISRMILRRRTGVFCHHVGVRRALALGSGRAAVAAAIATPHRTVLNQAVATSCLHPLRSPGNNPATNDLHMRLFLPRRRLRS